MKSFFYTLIITSIVCVSFLPAFTQCPTNAMDTSGGAGVDFIFTVTSCTDLTAGNMFTTDGGATFISNDCTVPTVNITLAGGVPDALGFTIDFGGSIGSCTYDGAGVLLPVELIRFNAKLLQDKSIQLHWETAMEFNNEGFEVLHSSNGRDFEPIGWVVGHGNSYQLQQYDFVHDNPYAGDNYYQLRQRDYDGTTALSRVISIISEQNVAVDIYPNPIQKDGFLNVYLTLEDPTNITDFICKIDFVS